MTSKCIMLEESKLNTTGTAKYGEPVILFPKSSRRPSIWSKSFQRCVYDRLEEVGFDATTDYFVVVGHMVPVVEMAAFLVAKYGRVSFLFYSSTEGVYVPRVIGELVDERAHTTAV